jgi:BirA family biotin operon repressor/biotin-[acetyl-CoA-carboxylase] ligase
MATGAKRDGTEPRRESSALPADIALGLAEFGQRRFARTLDVRWFRSVPSTMDVVAALADEGAAHGLVVVADEQTAGRGRRGHDWSSPAGSGLYFTLLARPAGHTSLITLAAGVAVRRGIERATSVSARLKWPNDLIVGSRKLAGILCEGLHGGTPDGAVAIGVGINLIAGSHPQQVAALATSVAGETGAAVDRGLVFAAVIEQLVDVLAALDRGAGGDILREWRRWALGANGATVEWVTSPGVQRGVTAGVDDLGALLVDTPCGRQRIVGGEVRWLKPEA